MKIAFLIQSFLKDESAHVNGTLVQAFILAEGLAERGHEVHYITTSKKKKGYEIVGGINVHYLPAIENVFKSGKVFNLVEQKLNEIAPDIVYTRGRHRFTYLAGNYAKQEKCKFIWASNGEDGCEPQKFIPKLWKSKRNIIKKLILSIPAFYSDIKLKKGIELANISINQTQLQQQSLKEHFNKTGIIIRSAHPVPQAETKQDNPKIVLWLATVSPAKQTHLFVKLAKEIKQANWQFVLVGGSNNNQYVNNINQEAKTVSNLQIVGKVPFEETAQYFAKASIFVNTSDIGAEGLPNTFVQAWLNACPVVSLNFDPDNALTKYQTGIYAEQDYNKLKDAVIELFTDTEKRNQMSENARKYAVENFDREIILDKYEELIR